MNNGTPKRQAILAATEALLAGRRMHEVTIDDVASAAHVSKGTVYRFFRDKDDLLFHTITAGFDELCERVREQSVDPDQPLRTLVEIADDLACFFQKRRRTLHLLYSEEDRALASEGKARQRWEQHRGQLIDAVAEVVDRCQSAGALRQDLPPPQLAELFLGLLRARARYLHRTGSDAISIPQLVDFFVEGAGPSR